LDFHEYVNDAGIQLVWSRPNVNRETFALALDAARAADAVVLTMGLSPRLEGEEMKVPVEGFAGGDRIDIGLPRAQQDLMEEVVALGKPTVLVLMNGSALAVNWAAERVPAIVEAWYPGQAGGAAIADVLFGDYNPAGRLPVTFYKSVDQLPPFDDYRMTGRTYRFFKDEPLYPFGYGLSYTTFSYRNPSISAPEIRTGDEVRIGAEVQNTGVLAGEEVVQLYLRRNDDPEGPVHFLAGFQRIAFKPSERKTVRFTVKPEQLARVAAGGLRTIDPGTVEFFVGGGQPDSGKQTNSFVRGTFRLSGTSKTLP
jgi:beta-glucosidase